MYLQQNKNVKKKIIHYLTSLNDGGAETIVKEYVTKIDRNLFEVKVVVLWLFGETANLKSIREAGIEIIVLFPKWSLSEKIVNKICHTKFVATRLKRVLEQEKPDILHVHLELLATLLPNIKLIHNTKLVYTCHSRPINFLGDIRPKERDAAIKLIKYCNLGIIALHEDMAHEINEMFNIDNTAVINNGIDLPKYYNIEESKSEIRKSLNLPSDCFLLGHVGRFSKVKNHEFILKTFIELKKLNPKAHLLLVGAGELFSQIQGKIVQYDLKKDVTILTGRSDIPRIMKAMDFFIMPSIYEGFGIVLIEAQAAGLSCIASNTISKTTCVSNNVIYKALDEGAKEWAKAILVPENYELAKYDISNFDMNSEIKKLEQLYLQL